MRKFIKKKAIFLATFFLFVFIVGLLSCSNSSSNNDDNNPGFDDEKLYEISGTIAANYSYAPENILRAENYGNLSRNAITIGDITEGTVTAQEAEVSGSNWTEKTNGRSVTGEITTNSEGQLVFTIKLTNGNWLLGADCGTYATLNSERTQVVIDTSVAGEEKGYKDDIEITVRPKMTANTNGSVNLTITDATNTINTIKAVEIPVSSNSATETDVQTIVQSAANSHTFVFNWNNSTEVTAGAHNVRFDFYTEASDSITGSSVPVYSCEEIINVYSNQETNTWVKNGVVTGGSSIANQIHMTVKTTGARLTNEADFILTQECLDLYRRFYYEVTNAAELKAAVEKIISENDSDTTTTAANRVEYKIVLANDIVYSDSTNLMTFVASGSDYEAYKYALALNPSQPLKISIRGKNGLKKLDLNTNAGDSSINKICGIYLNEKVELILGNINITRAGTNESTPVAGRGVWRDCKLQGGSLTAGYITLKNKVLITGNSQNIYFTKTNTGTTVATAPLKIHRSFTTDSRIGLSFADTSSALETPCIVTNGYANGAGGLFATDTSVNIFFSDSGYNVYLADEITWNNEGGQGYIDAEMIPEITFDACGNMQNSSEYGGAKYDTYNSRYLIGYKDSSAFIYVVPFMPDFSNEPLLIQPGYNSRDFTLQLEYENGGLVPVGSDPANPTWKTEAYEETLIAPETGEEMDTPVQTGLKFSISATDNTIPTGRYKLVATAKYNGNQYTEYWDLSYVKVLFSVDNNFIKLKSGNSQNVNLKVMLDEGNLKNVSNYASISGYKKRITGINADGSFATTDSSSFYSYQVSIDTNTPCAYLLDVTVHYNGIKCYTDTGTTTEFKTFISVDEKDSFYFIPGCSIQTSLNYDNLQTIINHAQDNNINDYNIYLMGNALATDGTMQETEYYLRGDSSDISSYGNSFININAYTDATPVKIRFVSYGSTVYSINAAGTTYSAGSAESVLSTEKKGRVLYIGSNASVTLEKVQIKGGYSHKGSAFLADKGSTVNLIDSYIGDTSEEIISYYGATESYNNVSFSDNGNPGSYIYIDSGTNEDEISTFNCKNTIFNRNMGMMYIGNEAKFSITGTVSSTNPDVSSTMFYSNVVSGNSNLIDIDDNQQPGSYIKGVVFYKNWFVNASTPSQADKPVSIIKTSSENLLLENIRMYNNASSFTGTSPHFYSSGVLCASNNSRSSVELKDCHFYANNQSINSSTDSGCDFVALCLRGGTADITNCTFTELSGTNNYAIYTGVTGTNSPASILQNRINLNGSFYTDGGIYLCKPYASGGGSTIGIRLFIDNSLVLPDAAYLASLSGLTYAADPTTFGTIILHADSTTPAAGYMDYSQVLEGTIQDVKAYYNKFTVKLDDTNGTEKSLNDRGQVEW